MEIVVLNIQGEKTSNKVTLSDEIYNVEPNDHAIYLDVKLNQANKRQGTHSSKERSDLSGSTRKLKKQKGSGSARYGDIKNPLFRGGARIFGPQMRDYSFKLNKKVKQLARKSALTYKVQSDSLIVLEDFSFDVPKTKSYLDLVQKLNISNKKSLLVVAESNKNVYLSSRNLKGKKVVIASQLNTYDILNAESLIVSVGAIAEIEKMFE